MRIRGFIAATTLAAALAAPLAGCMGSGTDDPGATRKYATYLEEYLATGRCKVAVVAWSEPLRLSAETYVRSNGHPTSACKHPDVIIVVHTTQTDTGSQWQSRYVILFS